MTFAIRRSVTRAVAALAVLLVVPTHAPAIEEGPASEISDLHRSIASLRGQIELASGDDFYLLLDPAGATLELVLHGVVLQSYAVSSIEVGRPRVVYVEGGAADGLRDRVWTHGEMHPVREHDRLEIRVDEANPAPEEIPVPPTPEERYPAPDRWLVRYAEGLSLEVVAADSTDSSSFGLWSALAHRAADLAAALFGDRGTRLRVELAREDAGTLYRSLPPATSLLILPGESGR